MGRIVVRIFRVDAALDGVATQLDVFLCEGQLLARGYPNCKCTRSWPVTNSVIRMLDLQAGVHLEKVEVAVLVDQEFNRAGVFR